MTFEQLQEKVLSWADDKDLLHAQNAEKQFMKFVEEVFEFKTEFDTWYWYKLFKFDESLESYLRNNNISRCKNLKLEMGDVFVTLIILCEQMGIDPVECLEMAYEKISKRKGKTINGNFYKQEDLEGME